MGFGIFPLVETTQILGKLFLFLTVPKVKMYSCVQMKFYILYPLPLVFSLDST